MSFVPDYCEHHCNNGTICSGLRDSASGATCAGQTYYESLQRWADPGCVLSA